MRLDNVFSLAREAVRAEPGRPNSAGDRPDGPTQTVDRQHTIAEAAECGRREGARNRPPSGATEHSATESAYIDVARAGIREKALGIAERAGGNLRAANQNALQPIDYDLLATEALAATAAEKMKHGEELVSARIAERSAKIDKEIFKDKHGLTREAAYAPSPLQPVSWLMVMLLIETMINGPIFMSGSDDGLLGGAVIAFICSLVNVGIGFGTGAVGIRYTRFSQEKPRKFGWTIVALGCAVGLAFNILVSVARSQLETQSDGANALTQLLISIGLGMAGMGIFLWSMAKGAGGRGQIFDKFVGYKEVAEANRETEEAYDEKKAEYRAAVEEAYDGADARLNALDVDNGARLLTIRDMHGDLEQTIIHVAANAQSDADKACELVRSFQEANRRIREDQSPVYFGQDLPIEVPGFDTPAFQRLGELVAQGAEIQDANRALVTRLKRLFAERRVADIEGFLELVDRIQSRADERLVRDALNGLQAANREQ